MQQLAGSFYLASTALFAVMAIAIGVRLELLYRRTGKLAERMLGHGLLGTAGLGYGLMMVGLIGRGFVGGPEAPAEAGSAAFALLWWVTLAGWVFHNLGVMCMLRFVRLVFRPRDAWAAWLERVMAILLWTSWGFHAAAGGVTTGQPTPAYWVMMTVVGTYPLWSGGEALRYYGLMRRRAAIGLADPVVANRFLLWSLASLCAVAAIWCVNVPALLGVEARTPTVDPVVSTCMLLTALFGLGAVLLYWLTFFPPAWYRDRISRGAQREAS